MTIISAPTMYYTTIPLVSERPNIRRWDASNCVIGCVQTPEEVGLIVQNLRAYARWGFRGRCSRLLGNTLALHLWRFRLGRLWSLWRSGCQRSGSSVWFSVVCVSELPRFQEHNLVASHHSNFGVQRRNGNVAVMTIRLPGCWYCQYSGSRNNDEAFFRGCWGQSITSSHFSFHPPQTGYPRDTGKTFNMERGIFCLSPFIGEHVHDLLIDLLAIHMIRSKDSATIISYHPVLHDCTTAERLHQVMARAGGSVYWNKIFKASEDPTFFFLAILWYALYVWDEAFEVLYNRIKNVEVILNGHDFTAMFDLNYILVKTSNVCDKLSASFSLSVYLMSSNDQGRKLCGLKDTPKASIYLPLSLLPPPGSCERDPRYHTAKSGPGPWAFAIIVT
ncbi:uncharacterized protein F5147DRAFT_790609 [Suillus discolor]|uniref:Uncharacterized protein n=1 Tax=Suillus discolor TaxID=1912936 RepID=A0A9P7JM84_9AGAM|nr:uncharacterized protein F5147DRAFT_790609 [Suillus discolor]KAG2087613.1 hypothetical protein F5147DRAFT_790609 [Suillus discolor]